MSEAAVAAAPELAVITVRIPSGLHVALKEEAWRRKTSLNRLCVDVLECLIDEAPTPLPINHQPPTH